MNEHKHDLMYFSCDSVSSLFSVACLPWLMRSQW